MRTPRLTLLVLSSLLLLSPVAGVAGPPKAGAPKEDAARGGPVKVVYHLSEDLEQATQALRYIRNHLSVDPGAKIVVVAHASGIDFLLEGAQDAHKNPYNVAVEDLAMQGVEFRVCNLTLQTRKIDKAKVLPEAKIVPSGVAEIARLQTQEGYAYIRP
ncbi:MAG: DsrE family protein [Myxococcaceae bacterium]|nr:DsrE family protein [Myxococcaceae bacterium]